MKKLNVILLLTLAFILSTCSDLVDPDSTMDSASIEEQSKKNPNNKNVNFQYQSTINVGGEASAEISAYDPSTKKLFVVNGELNQVSVFSLDDLSSPVEETPIAIGGVPNSVAVEKGLLAVAVQADPAQDPGTIAVYNTSDQSFFNEYTVGALPDMVTFAKNGQLILSANEGEPSDDYSVDPLGTVSIIDLKTDEVTTLDFSAFNSQEAALEA